MAGEWKTIDQRETAQRRARKTQRHGLAVAGLGAAAVSGSYGLGNVVEGNLRLRKNPAVQEAAHITEPVRRRGAKWALHHASGDLTLGTLSRRQALKLSAKRVPHNPLGAGLLGGAALVGVGGAHYGQGRGREAYQQSRINARRRANANRSIGKSVLTALRRTKTAAGPVIRTGVTRMGTVGVEYEHEGVKGWGANHDAARAAWEQNRAMRKSLDSPTTQPRYGGGGGVGRRIIEKAAPHGPAVKAPTQARSGGQQPARSMVAPTAMPTVASTPMMPQLGTLPASQVVPMSKGLRLANARAVLTGRGYRDPRFARNSAIQDALHGQSLRGLGRHRNRADAEVARTTHDLFHGEYGSRSTTHLPYTPDSPVAKADRYFDPEDRRQRRLGVTAGALAAGGGYLAVDGGRQAARHVRAQNASATRGALEHLSSHFPPGTDKRARVLVNAISGRKATVIHHGTTGRLAGGTALIGGAGLLLRRGDDPRKRRWR